MSQVKRRRTDVEPLFGSSEVPYIYQPGPYVVPLHQAKSIIPLSFAGDAKEEETKMEVAASESDGKQEQQQRDAAYAQAHGKQVFVLRHPHWPKVQAQLTITRGAVPPELCRGLDQLIARAPRDTRLRDQLYDKHEEMLAQPDNPDAGVRDGFDEDVLVMERGVVNGFTTRWALRGGLTANFKDEGVRNYRFNGSTPRAYSMKAGAPYVQRLQTIMKTLFHEPFTLCLSNLMVREPPAHSDALKGTNALGWHADNENDLLPGTIPCYVGGSRNPSRVAVRFKPSVKRCKQRKVDPVWGVKAETLQDGIRRGFIVETKNYKKDATLVNSVVLAIRPGDIYAMEGVDFQSMFQHCVPPGRVKETGERLSYTWRVMKREDAKTPAGGAPSAPQKKKKAKPAKPVLNAARAGMVDDDENLFL